MARLQSIHILLAFAIQNDLLLHQMDVVTAFLNGTLEEEIYMQPGKFTLTFTLLHLHCYIYIYTVTLNQGKSILCAS